MTRILLLGASGRTGLLTLTEALSRNHTITALVRRPESIKPQDGVFILTGTPENQPDIAKAFDSAPASDPIRVVVSTLNSGRTSDFPWAKTTCPPKFLSDCARNAIAVMGERGCKKVVWLGTNGVGSSRAATPWFFNFIGELFSLLMLQNSNANWRQWITQTSRSLSTTITTQKFR